MAPDGHAWDAVRFVGVDAVSQIDITFDAERLGVPSLIGYRCDYSESRKATLRLRRSYSVLARVSLERLDVRTIHRIVRCTSVAKGFSPYHPHQLRHACATHMHDHGAPIQAVAAMLGHARLSTAQIYTRVSPVRMLDVYRRAHPHSTGA